MPDNIRMSVQNAIVIVGFILTVGISYSAISGRVESQENINLAQSGDIKDLQDGSHNAALERQENRLMYKDIKESNARIERWISTIELRESANAL